MNRYRFAAKESPTAKNSNPFKAALLRGRNRHSISSYGGASLKSQQARDDLSETKPMSINSGKSQISTNPLIRLPKVERRLQRPPPRRGSQPTS